jgi:Fe2+ or Zn2+ uptake regulation protein
MDHPQIDTIRQALRAKGGRMTAQRRLIFETLIACDDHPTAEEIFKRASRVKPELNLSTVYRTLRWLEQAGLVNTRLFEGEPRQERFDPVGERPTDHYHFRCRGCNAIIEFPAPLLEAIKAQFSQEHGASVDSASLTLYGLCAACREK